MAETIRLSRALRRAQGSDNFTYQPEAFVNSEVDDVPMYSYVKPTQQQVRQVFVSPPAQVSPQITINQDVRRAPRKSVKFLCLGLTLTGLIVGVLIFIFYHIYHASEEYKDNLDNYGDNSHHDCPHFHLMMNERCDQAILSNPLCNYDKPDCRSSELCHRIEPKIFFDCYHPFHQENPSCNHLCIWWKPTTKKPDPCQNLLSNKKCDSAILSNPKCDYDKPDCTDFELCFRIESTIFFNCEHSFHQSFPKCNPLCHYQSSSSLQTTGTSYATSTQQQKSPTTKATTKITAKPSVPPPSTSPPRSSSTTVTTKTTSKSISEASSEQKSSTSTTMKSTSKATSLVSTTSSSLPPNSSPTPATTKTTSKEATTTKIITDCQHPDLEKNGICDDLIVNAKECNYDRADCGVLELCEKVSGAIRTNCKDDFHYIHPYCKPCNDYSTTYDLSSSHNATVSAFTTSTQKSTFPTPVTTTDVPLSMENYTTLISFKTYSIALCPLPKLLWNGICDPEILNLPSCNYDAPDCLLNDLCTKVDDDIKKDCSHSFHLTHPACGFCKPKSVLPVMPLPFCYFPFLIKNGYCSPLILNHPECYYDKPDCGEQELCQKIDKAILNNCSHNFHIVHPYCKPCSLSTKLLSVSPKLSMTLFTASNPNVTLSSNSSQVVAHLMESQNNLDSFKFKTYSVAYCPFSSLLWNGVCDSFILNSPTCHYDAPDCTVDDLCSKVAPAIKYDCSHSFHLVHPACGFCKPVPMMPLVPLTMCFFPNFIKNGVCDSVILNHPECYYDKPDCTVHELCEKIHPSIRTNCSHSFHKVHPFCSPCYYNGYTPIKNITLPSPNSTTSLWTTQDLTPTEKPIEATTKKNGSISDITLLPPNYVTTTSKTTSRESTESSTSTKTITQTLKATETTTEKNQSISDITLMPPNYVKTTSRTTSLKTIESSTSTKNTTQTLKPSEAITNKDFTTSDVIFLSTETTTPKSMESPPSTEGTTQTLKSTEITSKENDSMIDITLLPSENVTTSSKTTSVPKSTESSTSTKDITITLKPTETTTEKDFSTSGVPLLPSETITSSRKTSSESKTPNSIDSSSMISKEISYVSETSTQEEGTSKAISASTATQSDVTTMDFSSIFLSTLFGTTQNDPTSSEKTSQTMYITIDKQTFLESSIPRDTFTTVTAQYETTPSEGTSSKMNSTSERTTSLLSHLS